MWFLCTNFLSSSLARWPPCNEPSFHDCHWKHGSCCLRPAAGPHWPKAESRQPDRPAGQDHQHRGGECHSEGTLYLLHNNALLIIIMASWRLTSRIEGSLVNNRDDFSSGRLKLFTFHGVRGRASFWLLAGEPDCCYKEQRQRECLLKTQSPHSCGKTHAISLHGSHFSCVPLLVEEYVRNEVEERLSRGEASEVIEIYPSWTHLDIFVLLLRTV